MVAYQVQSAHNHSIGLSQGDAHAHIGRPLIPVSGKWEVLKLLMGTSQSQLARERLNRLVSTFAGADAHHLVDREDEDLAVPHVTGSSGALITSISASTSASSQMISNFTFGTMFNSTSVPR